MWLKCWRILKIFSSPGVTAMSSDQTRIFQSRQRRREHGKLPDWIWLMKKTISQVRWHRYSITTRPLSSIFVKMAILGSFLGSRHIIWIWRSMLCTSGIWIWAVQRCLTLWNSVRLLHMFRDTHLRAMLFSTSQKCRSQNTVWRGGALYRFWYMPDNTSGSKESCGHARGRLLVSKACKHSFWSVYGN